TYELAQRGAQPLPVVPAAPKDTIYVDDARRLDTLKTKLATERAPATGEATTVRVYHGARTAFDAFDDSKVGDQDVPAHYFTDSPEVASHYADAGLSEVEVDPRAIKGANVRRVDITGRFFDADKHVEEFERLLNLQNDDPRAVVDELTRRGY